MNEPTSPGIGTMIARPILMPLGQRSGPDVGQSKQTGQVIEAPHHSRQRHRSIIADGPGREVSRDAPEPVGETFFRAQAPQERLDVPLALDARQARSYRVRQAL